MDYFVFVYRPGPAWLPDRGVLQQPLAEHFAYMEKLQQDGVLCVGGPFKDGAGALGILQTADLQAATALVQTDPAVHDGVFEAELHPWHPSVPGTVQARAWE